MSKEITRRQFCALGLAGAAMAITGGLGTATAYAEEAYGFEISYDKEEFYNAFNGALEELLKDGTIQGIIDKYIKAE